MPNLIKTKAVQTDYRKNNICTLYIGENHNISIAIKIDFNIIT
jgi:hypothetical protein